MNINASDRQSYPKIATYKDQKYVTWNINGTNTQTRQILLSKVIDDAHNLPIMQKTIAKYLDDGESHVTALDRNVLVFWTDGNAQGHNNLYYTLVPIMVMSLEILLTYPKALMTHRMWKLHLAIVIYM